MRTVLALLILCLATSAYAFGPRCEKDPLPGLVRSTVMLERVFEPEEVFVNENLQVVFGIEGTAWFVDKQTIATIGHVVTSAKLDGSWKEIILSWSEAKDEEVSVSLKVRAKLKDIFVGYEGLEPIMTLELEIPIDDAYVPKIRAAALKNKEAVVGLGYRDGALRFAVGYLNYPPQDGEPSPDVSPPPPYLPFEIFDADEPEKNDRMVFDHGASGAPLFDCNGEVVAVVHALLTKQAGTGAFGTLRYTTSWGLANMTAASAANMLGH